MATIDESKNMLCEACPLPTWNLAGNQGERIA